METTLEKTYEKEYTIRSVEMDSEYLLKKIDAVRFFQETYALYCKDNKLAAFDLVDKNIYWASPSPTLSRAYLTSSNYCTVRISAWARSGSLR